MNRFWNWLIEFMPLWLAPNVITLIGFVGMIVATAYALYCNPTFRGALPLDAIIIVFVLVFNYQVRKAFLCFSCLAEQNKTIIPLYRLWMLWMANRPAEPRTALLSVSSLTMDAMQCPCAVLPCSEVSSRELERTAPFFSLFSFRRSLPFIWLSGRSIGQA
jgi:hypothetical protein